MLQERKEKYKHDMPKLPIQSSPSAATAKTLKTLKKGDEGRIDAINSPQLALALLKMGIIIGDWVQITDIAPLGDPIAIKVNGTKISLRKKDASAICITRK